jgi:hypothetical protein
MVRKVMPVNARNTMQNITRTKSRYLLLVVVEWVNYESEAAEAAAAITILSRHGPRDFCRRSLTE